MLIATCDRCQGSDSPAPSCADIVVICEPRGGGVHLVHPYPSGCTGNNVVMIGDRVHLVHPYPSGCTGENVVIIGDRVHLVHPFPSGCTGENVVMIGDRVHLVHHRSVIEYTWSTPTPQVVQVSRQ